VIGQRLTGVNLLERRRKQKGGRNNGRSRFSSKVKKDY